MKKQNLRSEAAIKRWLAANSYKDTLLGEDYVTVSLRVREPNRFFQVVAEIDLRELVKKRQPLTGIKKQMSAIVSGKKKVKK